MNIEITKQGGWRAESKVVVRDGKRIYPLHFEGIDLVWYRHYSGKRRILSREDIKVAGELKAQLEAQKAEGKCLTTP